MTLNPAFKVTILCNGEYFKTVHFHLLSLQYNVPLNFLGRGARSWQNFQLKIWPGVFKVVQKERYVYVPLFLSASDTALTLQKSAQFSTVTRCAWSKEGIAGIWRLINRQFHDDSF